MITLVWFTWLFFHDMLRPMYVNQIVGQLIGTQLIDVTIMLGFMAWTWFGGDNIINWLRWHIWKKKN